MRRWIGLLLTVSVILSFAGCQREIKEDDTPIEELTLESGTLKVGMYMQVPPMESITEDTVTPIGFDVEMAKMIGDNLGLKVEFVDTTQENLLPSLEAKIVDCVISTVEITAENEKKYHVTQPYADVTAIKGQIQNKAVTGKIGVYTSKANGQLMLRLDNVISIIKKNGQLAAISKHYFGTDITKDI